MEKTAYDGRLAHRSEVINLCFHGIGSPGRPIETGEEPYWVGVPQFMELLRVIRGHPQVRLTFDDGNASDAVHALPALLEHDLTATFFVVSGRLDQPGSLRTSDVRTLVKSGMTIGSHGMFHRPWRGLGTDALRVELADAAAILAEVVHQPIRAVACPFGAYDRRVLSAIRRHGFTRAYTVDGAAACGDSWLQSRYSVRNTDTPATLDRLIRSPRGSAFDSVVRIGKTFVKRMR
jgi:peptidoglycan/xylan/chitin deacetylase (PgdA/CDA1 family)